MTQLFERDSGRGFDVEQRQSEVDQLKGQLEAAQWNLDKTIVRAPADGYVTNLALRKGARVANLPLSPVMAFIDTSRHHHRRRDHADRRPLCRAGPAGRSHLQVRARQDLQRQGREHSAGDRDRAGADLGHRRDAQGDRGRAVRRPRQARRRGFRAKPAGRQRPARPPSSPNTSRSTHIIRRVLLRQIAILNYVNPF